VAKVRGQYVGRPSLLSQFPMREAQT